MSEYSETTNVGFLGRIKESFKGVIGGFAMLVIGIGLLWWNEGRTVNEYRAISEIGENVVESTTTPMNTEHEGKLIHISGTAVTEDVLTDSMTGASENAFFLMRDVEFYQWKEIVKEEKKDKAGGGQEITKTYSYQKVWSDQPIDSSRFKKSNEHYNTAPNINDAVYTAQNIMMDDYKLTSDQIGVLKSQAQPFETTDEMALQLEEQVIMTTTSNTEELYVGYDPSDPIVGDARVTYTYVPASQAMSVIGVKKGNMIVEYTTANGISKTLIEAGMATPQEMVANAQSANRIMGWVLRAVGVILIFGGFKLILAPIVALGMVLPVLGAIADMGTGIIAFVLTAVISLVVIAVAWLAFRPLIAVPMLLVAVGLLVWLKFFKGKDAVKTAEPKQAK